MPTYAALSSAPLWAARAAEVAPVVEVEVVPAARRDAVLPLAAAAASC